MKVRNLFNLSFEESKRIVLPKNKLMYSNEGSETHEAMMGFLRSDLRFRLPILGVGLEVFIAFIYKGWIKNFLLIFIGIIYFFGISRLLFLRKKYYVNWVTVKRKTHPASLTILISVYTVMIPIGIKLTLIFAGYWSLYLQLIILGVWTIREFVKLKSIISGRRNNIGKYINRVIIFLLIICIIISFQYTGEETSNFVVSLLGKIYFLLLSGCGVWVIFKIFRVYLSYYYIDKYSRQYRLYYRIPDSVWYFSKEEAEKRNDPVYPPRRKKVSED